MSSVEPLLNVEYGMISAGPEYCNVAVPLVNGVVGGNVLPDAGYGGAVLPRVPPDVTW